MKEAIKQFVDMLESDKQFRSRKATSAEDQETNDLGFYGAQLRLLHYIAGTPEYAALKSLANAPKIEVTDEQVTEISRTIFKRIEHGDFDHRAWLNSELESAVKAALEAAFNHIGETNKKVEKELISDGWITHDGSDGCPVEQGSDCEVRFADGEISRDGTPELWCWNELGDKAIIAYRIISEPENHKLCRCNKPHWDYATQKSCYDCGKFIESNYKPEEKTDCRHQRTVATNIINGVGYDVNCITKCRDCGHVWVTEEEPQDFEQWATRQSEYGDLDLLKPSEIIHLQSEWEKMK